MLLASFLPDTVYKTNKSMPNNSSSQPDMWHISKKNYTIYSTQSALRAVIFITIFSSVLLDRLFSWLLFFFVTVKCPCSSTTKCHVNLFVYNNNNNNSTQQTWERELFLLHRINVTHSNVSDEKQLQNHDINQQTDTNWLQCHVDTLLF